MVDVATFTSVLTAAGFGTIVGGVIARGKDRREARAAALKAVNEVEDERWETREWKEFIAAVRNASAPLLLAQVPRSITRSYLTYVCLARFETDEWMDSSTGEMEYGLPAEVAELARTSLSILVMSLWHPWIGFSIGRLRVRMLNRRARAMESVPQSALSAAIANVP